MITFLTIPRPFVGEFAPLQQCALASWRLAAPGCDILCYGDDTGDAPLVDSVFATAEHQTRHEWLCFCSADIILRAAFPAILASLAGVARPLVIGRRHDIEPGAPLSSAVLHAPCGVDYFLYRRGTLGPVLPFTVRGGGGDNWLVWKAMAAWNMTVIDATASITALHTNHSHPEWPNGKAGRQGSAEQAYNRNLYTSDGMTRPYGIDNAPWLLRDGQLLAREGVTA